MAENTAIEWCDHTVNFWEGCTKVSPACDNCYAEARAKRFKSVKWGNHPRRRMGKATRNKIFKYQRAAATFMAEHGRRQRVFINSLSDFFDNQVPQEWRDEAWEMFRVCIDLDIILLTKRPQNIKKMLPPFWDGVKRHIWLGTTAENQRQADLNVPHILQFDCAVRFVSAEPLLGNICFTRLPHIAKGSPGRTNGLTGETLWPDFDSDIGSKLDWLIVGGESGPGARPLSIEWARSSRDQCKAAGVPIFIKQLSGKNGKVIKDIDQFPADLQIREYPE